MLYLVMVNRSDVDTLFELVTIFGRRNQRELLAGVMELHYHFNSTDDVAVKMVLPADLHQEMKEIVANSLLPQDAKDLGIPDEEYKVLIQRLPVIQKNFYNPDLTDPNFVGSVHSEPKKEFLN